MPLILGTNSIKDTGFNVANSLRFNSASSDYLNRTNSVSEVSAHRQTFTFSFWLKRSKLGTNQELFGVDNDGSRGNNYFIIDINTADELDISEYISGSQFRLITNRQFRDVSAWYHIVLAVDTTQSTASNRIKLYINSVQETSFSTENYPSQNYTTKMFSQNKYHAFGRSGAYIDGYLAEVVAIAGTQLDPTSFGEFDSDTNIWKPIDVSGLTFGTNGFYLDFENSGSLGADVSGNSNNFTVNNLTSIDQSTDTCTNNMPTFNSNDNQRQGFTFTQGNLKITATPSYDYVVATMGVSSGKWYWETKIITIPSGDYIYNGISDHNQYQADFDMGGEAGQYCLSRVAGKIKAASTSETTYGGSMVANDIQGFALDVDNLKLYISNNGQWSNGSGAWDSTTFNASTGVINIAYSTLPGGGTHWFPAIGNGSGNIGMEINFGSSVSAISSGNSDGNGYGNFEFPVPSGYYALNTKNLAEYG
nr:spry domain protein [uncultured Mediterranean phage uvMED]